MEKLESKFVTCWMSWCIIDHKFQGTQFDWGNAQVRDIPSTLREVTASAPSASRPTWCRRGAASSHWISGSRCVSSRISVDSHRIGASIWSSPSSWPRLAVSLARSSSYNGTRICVRPMRLVGKMRKSVREIAHVSTEENRSNSLPNIHLVGTKLRSSAKTDSRRISSAFHCWDRSHISLWWTLIWRYKRTASLGGSEIPWLGAVACSSLHNHFRFIQSATAPQYFSAQRTIDNWKSAQLIASLKAL